MLVDHRMSDPSFPGVFEVYRNSKDCEWIVWTT